MKTSGAEEQGVVAELFAMSAEAPRHIVGLEADDGLELNQGSLFKVIAAWTSGAVCISEATFAPRWFAPMHRHEHECQIVVVVSGTIGFYVEGDDEIELSAGGYSYRPIGRLHASWNPTDEPARVMEITSPATSFEACMRDLSTLRDRGEATVEAVRRRAKEAGIIFESERTDELCAKHQVSPHTFFWNKG